MAYQYPLNMRFKLISLTPQVYITEANGNEVVFVRQRMLKLKEDIQIYSDSSKSEEIFRIKADRIIDFSAHYHFTDSRLDEPLGSIKRKGMRSLWRATYFVSDQNEQQTHHIKEDNPWAKVGDALLGEIPFVGFLTSYLFHPIYTAYKGIDREDEQFPVMRMTKQPSLFERFFVIDKLDESLTAAEENRLLLAFMMTVQLERGRS